MRWVVWLLLLLVSAVGLALLMRFNHGNVAILWPPYRVDFSVNLALLILLAGFATLHLLLVGVSKAMGLPARVREYRIRRQQDLARTAMRDSLLALFEGRFGRAERLAESARGDERFAGPAALVAARAAHRMREFDRRDRWLSLAAEDKGCMNAELTTSAELALEELDVGRALAAIDQFHGKGLRHIHSLRIALRASELAEDWPRVLALLRQLEKRDALPEAAVRGLRVKACRALFAVRSGDAGSVRELWNGLKPFERALPECIEAAATAFAASGNQEAARSLVEDAMRAEISPILLEVYVALQDIPARERIQQAEQWRSLHGDDPLLFLALGRLCATEGLWGKAEEYLSRSLSVAPTVQAHLALATLAEKLDRQELAVRHFRLAATLRG
ncbi:MAG: hypothetical protein RIS35_2617 [Pseudomonadota bacterium]